MLQEATLLLYAHAQRHARAAYNHCLDLHATRVFAWQSGSTIELALVFLKAFVRALVSCS